MPLTSRDVPSQAHKGSPYGIYGTAVSTGRDTAGADDTHRAVRRRLDASQRASPRPARRQVGRLFGILRAEKFIAAQMGAH